MFFTIRKLEARINELEEYRYINRKPINGIVAKQDGMEIPFTIGSYWQGRDAYLTLTTDFDVPNYGVDSQVVLLFDLGTTGSGFNSGFESMLKINGNLYQGVDSNHKEVFLDKEMYGTQIKLELVLWSGLEGGGQPREMRHFFNYADYAVLSPDTDDLYYTSKNMLEAVKVIDENSEEYNVILSALDAAFMLIEYTTNEVEFYASIKKANDKLQALLNAMHKKTDVTITAVGHTHIDVAWLWRLRHTREKVARSFSTVLSLMRHYPEYIFQQAQPQLYDYIKQDHPELYGQIKKKIDEGVWEVDGAMWVEADCNIPSGESLIRQILYGAKFIKDEFGKDVHYLWLPDVFGYSWALPQILKKCGISAFATTKISWNQYNRMPHDTFIWRGIDGSEILAHFITTPYPGRKGSWGANYNDEMLAETIKGAYTNYRDKQINSDILVPYGYGDGGGGVTRDMLENRRRLHKIPGMPNIKTGNVRDYFKRLIKRVENAENYVHTWDGELYLEYHRGTYTSQAFVKKANRRLEESLREVEILNIAGFLFNRKPYPTEDIRKAYEILLRNQFHDIIPGSSITEVYEDAREEYAEAFAIIQKLEKQAIDNIIIKNNNSYSIFNSANFTRKNEIVFVKTDEVGCFADKDGRNMVAEKVDGGYLVEIPEIKPLNFISFAFIKTVSFAETKSAFNVFENGIETPFYKIKWNDGGQIISLYDKENRREVVKSGGFVNYLSLYEDKPLRFDAWDIDIFHYQKKKTLNANSIYIEKADSLSAEIVFEYNFGTSKIIQKMVCYAENRRIDFVTYVNWNERNQLLKSCFDVNIRETQAIYDIQCGNVARNTHWNTSWDYAKFETVAHRWVDFSQRDYGVALLNNCKYGHSVLNQTMTISLLKGAVYPDISADIGEHEFTYSILPHAGDFVGANVPQAAHSLNQPLKVLSGQINNCSLFKSICGDESVVIDAIKQAESGEGIIIRLRENTGSNKAISLQPAFNFITWQETDLLERVIGESNHEKIIEINLTPYEIKTLLIK